MDSLLGSILLGVFAAVFIAETISTFREFFARRKMNRIGDRIFGVGGDNND